MRYQLMLPRGSNLANPSIVNKLGELQVLVELWLRGTFKSPPPKVYVKGKEIHRKTLGQKYRQIFL